jgi:hypothetical protein
MRRLLLGMVAGAGLVILGAACAPSAGADTAPLGEQMGVLPGGYARVYRFRDGNTTCYYVVRYSNDGAVSCVKDSTP